MDPLYPARRLRHKFAKFTVRSYEEGPAVAIKPAIGIAAATLLVMGGSMALEDITLNEITPDTQTSMTSAETATAFDGEIDRLAQQRQAFLDMPGYMQAQDLNAMQETGENIRAEAVNLASRIVLSEDLSEAQAAELLNAFASEIEPIEEIGFETSDFGHLRESRAMVRGDLGTDWTQAAQRVTALAAEQDMHDQSQPFRIFDEDIEAEERIGKTAISSVMAGMFGMVGGMMWVLFALMLSDSRKINEWARETPKPKKPYAGH
ncbi:MAG: hypothetical protein EP349_10305 [Alphaproteobacteria bacterium]|nr:MAG: hypothetical protein EP349_10305 [Alphaproteobacteria bacterium]